MNRNFDTFMRFLKSPGGINIPAVLIIIGLGALIYSNTLDVPFYFDDHRYIVENPILRDWRGFFDASHAERLMSEGLLNQNFRSRTVTFLTFAINALLFDNTLFGYHLFNIVVHLLNGVLVYWLLILTMRTPLAVAQASDRGSPTIFALLAALMFISHPVQTEAVTYICQRFTSLATLFYLLSLVLYISWRLSFVGSDDAAGVQRKFRIRDYTCYAGSLLSAIMAMKTKEISFTLPLMICLYEWMFLGGITRRKILSLLPYLFGMMLIPMAIFSGKARYPDIVFLRNSLHDTGPATMLVYLDTQFMVLATYIRLLLLPINQNVDYSYPLARGIFHLREFFSLALLAALFSGATWLLRKSNRRDVHQAFSLRLIAWGIYWYFLTLAVESTFVPLGDLIFEHRLYLPSIGFCIVVMAIVTLLRARVGTAGKKIMTILAVFLILVWSAAAYARNELWRDRVALFRDTVAKSPDKPRPHYVLALEYDDIGDKSSAIQEYGKVIELEPTAFDAYFHIAAIFYEQGDYSRSLATLEKAGKCPEALRDSYYYKNYLNYYTRLGELYLLTERFPAAEKALRAAISLDPSPAVPMRILAEVYLRQNRFPEALELVKSALKLHPEESDTVCALGSILFGMKDYAGATREFKRSLALDPGNEQARRQLEMALTQSAGSPFGRQRPHD